MPAFAEITEAPVVDPYNRSFHPPPGLSFGLPFDLQHWIDEHRHELKPPVANRLLWSGADMDVMIVGGGTSRIDFHDDPHPEFFHQLEGSMVLRLIEEPGRPPHDIEISAGEVFLLPGHVRHSPRRADPDGVGLVVEFVRPPGVVDGFEWFCERCYHLLHRVEVQVGSIVKDLPPLFAAFSADLKARTCEKCGEVHPGSE